MEILSQPLPAWFFIILLVGYLYDVWRKDRFKARNRNSLHRQLLLGVNSIPRQNRFLLSRYSANFQEELQEFKNIQGQTNGLESAWDAADMSVQDTVTFENLRYLQQFLNLRLAPTWIAELQEDVWGIIGTFDGAIKSVCLDISKAGTKIGKIEASPSLGGSPFEVDINVRIFFPGMFDASEIFGKLHVVSQVHYDSKLTNKNRLDNEILRQMSFHLWNFYHGNEVGKEEGTFINYSEGDFLDLTFTGDCAFLREWTSQTLAAGKDPMELELKAFEQRMARDV